jgi:DeoR/GlpR family transcriptional regulator of sugar metabolism
LDCLSELTVKLEQKVKEFKNIGGYLNKRQKVIQQYIQDNQPVKISDITAHFPEYTQATIKKDLQYLITEFEIQKVGEKRGTVYILKKKEV